MGILLTYFVVVNVFVICIDQQELCEYEIILSNVESLADFFLLKISCFFLCINGVIWSINLWDILVFLFSKVLELQASLYLPKFWWNIRLWQVTHAFVILFFNWQKTTYIAESNLGEIDWLFGLLLWIWIDVLFLILVFDCGLLLLWRWDVSSLSTSYSLNVVVLPSWF